MNDTFLRVIASLHRDSVNLDLKTVDICFLIALHARAEQGGLTCLDEDVLVDVFAQVCDAIDGDSDHIAKRVTAAIQRLRDQRLLARVDGAGVIRAGEYALTQLALSIVRFFIADEALTRESLTLLTKTLLANLAGVKAAARKSDTVDEWRQNVITPLRVTVGDLISGIERRQRGLDLQQESVQHQIGELLQADWFRAVDRCQSLLDETTSTLAELNTVLLRDSNHVQTLLSDLDQLAAAAEMFDAEEAVRQVSEQVDRVAAWGGTRQHAWSEYYQYVHGFLRDVVRLDPDRALSERLRNQVVGWSRAPWHLVTSRSPSMCLLRDSDVRNVRPPVVRPRRDRDVTFEDVYVESDLLSLEDQVRIALSNGHTTLAAVLHHVLPQVAPGNRYLGIGRIARQVATEASARSARERDWASIMDQLEIEDWLLRDAVPHE